jgi:hypothetical protein
MTNPAKQVFTGKVRNALLQVKLRVRPLSFNPPAQIDQRFPILFDRAVRTRYSNLLVQLTEQSCMLRTIAPRESTTE